ncbi:MAG TPA: hypothetical protein VFE96_08570 [Candidatus Bathyarchaeia archaeon]|nr:hypothetical protein [Candidatus Bathyarchaeia archaeon]
MTRKLTVKREIRTLGIDLCYSERIIGAVARGGTFLDGIATFPSKPILNDRSIGSAITKLKFFPELRLIMTHDPKSRIDSRVIERVTKLPVIHVSSTGKRRLDGFELFKMRRKRLWAKSPLSAQILREILSTTWIVGALPEPLRIAHLVAGSRFFREKPPISG